MCDTFVTAVGYDDQFETSVFFKVGSQSQMQIFVSNLS